MIIEVRQGKVEGLKEKSVLTGKEYFSFLGIPYAKPPVGNLRFQEPRPAEKWNGIYTANDDKKICIQIRHLNENSSGFQGGEDCLYLNVFTVDPSVRRNGKPVMVFIHGGGFLTGSGSRDVYSPDFLINYDIVLVTLNYRLHIFGFLNLGIPECSGNCGLKDQLIALHWINENIRQFGGNPENVTIFGESAGSSSVHWHIISPLSRQKELFHKAIAQSGTAFNSWAFISNPSDVAFLIGSRMGFHDDKPLKLLQFMKEQPAEKLAAAVFKLYFDGMNRINEHDKPFSFVPSIEVVIKDAFIPDAPANLIKTAKPLPMIAGMNDKEGLIVMGLLTEGLLQKYRDDFTVFFQHRLNKASLSRRQMSRIARKVARYYFTIDNQLADESQSIERLINAFSDLICLQFYDSFELVAEPLYVYKFTFDGERNIFKSMFLQNVHPEIKGASHADELGYLFYQRCSPSVNKDFSTAQPAFKQRETVTIKNICSLWTNFAKTGNPTSAFDTKDVLDGSIDGWRPSTVTKPQYLHIGDELKMIDGKIMEDGRVFWQNLIEEAQSIEK